MADIDFNALVIQNRRQNDDYVSAKAWCKAFEKDWSDYRQTQQCKKVVRALAKKENTTITRIIESKRGRGSETWVHPVIAIDFAMWLSTDFGLYVKEIFLAYLKGDADIGADMMIRDHNKERVERAKRRLEVVGINKQVNEIASAQGIHQGQVHNTRYIGLYRKNAKQLRAECGARENETPLNYMSERDLSLNSLSNQAAIESGDLSRVGFAAELFRNAFEQASGKELNPVWQKSCLPPRKARKVLQSGQLELPV